MPSCSPVPQVVGLLLSRGAVTQYRNTYGNTPAKVCRDPVAAEWIRRVQVRGFRVYEARERCVQVCVCVGVWEGGVSHQEQDERSGVRGQGVFCRPGSMLATLYTSCCANGTSSHDRVHCFMIMTH